MFVSARFLTPAALAFLWACSGSLKTAEDCPEGGCCPDADGDGVCDADDLCLGGDDALDADTDGDPDFCDPCPADPANDADGDGVCESTDICPGGDDYTDSDNDGVPDFCDPCPVDAADDSDGDGVCDDADRCADFDDAIDGDGDGNPDLCDRCPVDPADDSDGDGWCDSEDLCASVELAGNDGWFESPRNPFTDAELVTGTFSTWFRVTNNDFSVFSGEGYLEISIQASGLGHGCSDGACTDVVSAQPLNDGRWHHAAVTWDATFTDFYVDGVYEGTVVPIRLPIPDSQDRSFNLGKHAASWVVGTAEGQIAESAAWNTVLSPAEIVSVRDGVMPVVPQLLWWPLTEGSGATSVDASGNGFDGSFVYGAVWSQTCPNADADLDGSPAWADADDNNPGVP